jgi:2-haloacid dehalogenase
MDKATRTNPSDVARRRVLAFAGSIAALAAGTVGVSTSSEAEVTSSNESFRPRKTKGPRILVFDVNESLLDLASLEQPFAEAVGRPEAMKEWFATLLRYSNVATLTNDYHPFGELGAAAAQSLARRYGVALDVERIKGLVALTLTLEPHPEVPAALKRLKAAGLRLVTLTNSAPKAAEAQLQHAGLRSLFEAVYTVEPVRLFKPHRKTYEAVAADLAVETSDLRMIAAHGWDVTGAMAAGCAAAFISRAGQELYPLGPKPDVIGKDMTEVGEAIIRVEIPA